MLIPDPAEQLPLQYHKAAHLGKQRAQKAQVRLFDYTGFAMLTYTIRKSGDSFEPVGEEELAARMNRGDETMLFICDSQGYAKAQSKPMSLREGEEIFKKMLADGMPEYQGQIKTVS